MANEIIDRWIPNYTECGYSLDDAREIAKRCEARQISIRRELGGSLTPHEPDWTAILAEVSEEYDREVTSEQIETLRNEASAAGDTKQVALCDLALSGNEAAKRECARVIADAAAQDDNE